MTEVLEAPLTTYDPELQAEVVIHTDEQGRLKVAGSDIGDSTMMSGAGGIEASFEDLGQIPLTEKTTSYTPVGHSDFVETLYKHADSIMAPKGFHLDGQRYVTSNEGARMFFVHSYRNGDTEMALALAGRNSYDKSMRAALALGAKVFNCDNTCINGEVTIHHRHTGNITDYLNDQIILKMHRSTETWDDMRLSRDRMVTKELSEDDGYALMGMMRAHTGKDKSAARRILITDNQWRSVQKYWEEPQHEYEGGNRTLWAWYNSFTFDFKSLKPQDQLPKHSSLHQFASSALEYTPQEQQTGFGEDINRILSS